MRDLVTQHLSKWSLFDQPKDASKSTDKVVALTARETGGGHKCYDEDSIIQFPEVRLNIGEAYNASTGVFTCPYTGVYNFFYSVMSAPGESVDVSLVVGANAEAQDGEFPDTATGSIYALCSEGQQIYVNARDNQCIYALSKTYFSGSIIAVL